MSGTSEGSKKAVAKILEKNPNHFKEIGKLGGQRLGVVKGFSLNRERAKASGAKGGKISKRGPTVYVSYNGEKVSLSDVAKREGITYRKAHSQMTAGKYEKI